MDAATLVTRRPRLVEAEVHGELMGLDVDAGHCYGFNATATEVWKLLAEPMTLDALCTALRARFDVDAQRCHESVSTLLARLADEGLVELTRPA